MIQIGIGTSLFGAFLSKLADYPSCEKGRYGSASYISCLPEKPSRGPASSLFPARKRGWSFQEKENLILDYEKREGRVLFPVVEGEGEHLIFFVVQRGEKGDERVPFGVAVRAAAVYGHAHQSPAFQDVEPCGHRGDGGLGAGVDGVVAARKIAEIEKNDGGGIGRGVFRHIRVGGEDYFGKLFQPTIGIFIAIAVAVIRAEAIASCDAEIHRPVTRRLSILCGTITPYGMS